MALRYFGIALGETKSQITENSSTTTKALEVSVDLAVFTKQEDVLKGLDLLADRIKQGVWPPA